MFSLNSGRNSLRFFFFLYGCIVSQNLLQKSVEHTASVDSIDMRPLRIVFWFFLHRFSLSFAPLDTYSL